MTSARRVIILEKLSLEKRKTCAYFEHVVFGQVIVIWEVTFVNFSIRNIKKVLQYLKLYFRHLLVFP